MRCHERHTLLRRGARFGRCRLQVVPNPPAYEKRGTDAAEVLDGHPFANRGSISGLGGDLRLEHCGIAPSLD